MTKPVITVVGSFAVGMTLRTQRMPVFGETLVGSDFDMGPGGKGSNQAVGVARLGAQATSPASSATTSWGRLPSTFTPRKASTRPTCSGPEEMATGVGFIILNAEGENGIILDMGANELMDGAFVDQVEEQIARSDVVMSVLEIPVAAAARAMALGKKHGVRTILNPAPATALDESVLQNVDYLSPNETELRILLGLAPDDPADTVDLAGQLRERGVGNLIVTMGEKGALILTEDGQEEVAGVSVEVVDTTGAGDAFNAGLAVALAEGKGLAEAVAFANRCGALACQALGVIPGLATRDMV